MLGGIIAGLTLFCTGETRAQTARPAEGDRLGVIRARGDLRVCVWPEYHGLSWRNPRNGELEGLDADMARLLASRLRLRLTIVEVMFGQGIVAAVEAGQCDIGMSGVTVTEDRAERVAFTKPYLATPLVAVVSRASTRVRQWAEIDRAGVVVAVTEGTPAEGLMRGALQRAELSLLRAPRRREAEVRSGRADVFITDAPYGRGLAAQQDWMRLVEAPPRFGETLTAYALPRGDAAWLAEANGFLAAVKADGSLARAAERYGILDLIAY